MSAETSTDARPWQGRAGESAVLRGLLSGLAEGRGGAVLVHGEAGIGKTALVDRLVGECSGARVLRCRGTQFETGLDHALLQQLCAPVLGERAALPAPQRRALESAFGMSDAPAAPLLVGLAVLGLLGEAARTAPVVCVVDDVPWGDAASVAALAFVARRVADERVAVVLTARDPDTVAGVADLPRLALGGLDDPDARALLASVHPGPMDPEVANRVVAEARGNPLALLEPSGDPTVEQGFTRRLGRLSPAGRWFATLAAAEPLGDPALLARAAEIAGARWADAREAEDDGLLTVGAQVRFRHPLVRSAAYGSATPAGRRAAHAALAEATDATTHPDRHAWHLGCSADGPDASISEQLEASAARARHRGGYAAAGAFLARAAELTPDPAARRRRTVAAAQLHQRAGDWRAAVALLDQVPPTSLTGEQATEAALLRARSRFQQDQALEATEQMLAVAAGLDADRSRAITLEAFAVARFVDRTPGGIVATARAIMASAPAREPPRPADLLLDALLAQVTTGGGEAAGPMRRAVAAFRSAAVDDDADPHLMEHACQLAVDLMDDDAAVELADRQVALARGRGALSVLSLALKFQAITRALTGRLADAAACGAEAAAIDDATRSAAIPFSDIGVAAWQGDLERTVALADAIEPPSGHGTKVASLHALVVAHLGVGSYDRAADLALAAFEAERRGVYHTWALLPELVEAATRAGRPDEARDAVGLLDARAAASGTEWARGTAAGARALIGTDPEANYSEAVDRLRRTSVTPYLARALLVHGEWLRRAGRRSEARDRLREALGLFRSTGVDGFARRAARELEATGEHSWRRSEDVPVEALTAQEVHIAQRVASGATTKEVAAALFLSPRTVDAHLRNIFRKRGITSRRQLRGLRL